MLCLSTSAILGRCLSCYLIPYVRKTQTCVRIDAGWHPPCILIPPISRTQWPHTHRICLTSMDYKFLFRLAPLTARAELPNILRDFVHSLTPNSTCHLAFRTSTRSIPPWIQRHCPTFLTIDIGDCTIHAVIWPHGHIYTAFFETSSGEGHDAKISCKGKENA